MKQVTAILCCVSVLQAIARADGLSVDGICVVPHVQSAEMRYRQKVDFSLGARVDLFLRNASSKELTIPPSSEIHVRGQSASELLRSDAWAWHNLPSAWGGEPVRLPPGAITVWSWNGKRASWGTNTRADLTLALPEAGLRQNFEVPIDSPSAWLSAVTFLGQAASPIPDSLVFHVANESDGVLRMEACRLWLPRESSTWRALLPQPWQTNLARFPADGLVRPHDRGGARVATGPLPLTYTAIEVKLADAHGNPRTLWAHLRIKREWFDISGGWVLSDLGGSNTLHSELFLRTLRRLHVNTAHIADVPGYTDQAGPDGLYTRYPLKYFNKLQPFDRYDSDVVLPRVHAVEFLGEPQYGGGRPVPPQEVWQALVPYAPTRLPTTVTHSEERVWRFYAGLSDYPHYDAYRVTAPSPDAWSAYDRWDGRKIRWGSPLETIGEMTRSLRELNRPRPVAYWSQGPHHDWEGYGGRKRGSPTPDELRMQAYHALASRITSLYWFNLSVRSLVKFPDLIDPMTRVGREIRMLDEYYLEGDAVSHKRVQRDGKLDWDIDVIAGPRGALVFALDLDYQADPSERVFRFGAPREGTFHVRLPSYVNPVAEVFRVDADGTSSVEHTVAEGEITLRDRASRVAVYVVASRAGERERIEARRQGLVAEEQALGAAPGRIPEVMAALRELLPPNGR